MTRSFELVHVYSFILQIFISNFTQENILKNGFQNHFPLSRWAYNISGFSKYGLMRNDILRETPEVQEAIRRLPEDIRDARVFRIKRAMQLSLQKIYLPKEEWTQIEDDVLYLEPYLKEVREENKSLEKWNSH